MAALSVVDVLREVVDVLNMVQKAENLLPALGHIPWDSVMIITKLSTKL